MIRISGGKYRGRMIDSPKKSEQIRPTTSMVRESLFNRLQTRIQGARFMDLFAGSGLMGLEALSRGASFVLAVEKDRQHLKLIQKNYAALGIPVEQAKAILKDALELLAKPNQQPPFDIAFLDPPYGFTQLQPLITYLESNAWITPGGLIIIEHGNRDPAPEGFDSKIYGNTVLSIKQL